MKKLNSIIAISLSLIMVRCEIREEVTVNQLRSPVIVVGIDKIRINCRDSGAITLKDSTGKLYSFDCATDIARSISNSRKVGDTLK